MLSLVLGLGLVLALGVARLVYLAYPERLLVHCVSVGASVSVLALSFVLVLLC